jgi:hypothetical protein
MKLMSFPLPDEAEPLPIRKDFLSSWLDQTSPAAVKVAALGYLGDAGVPEDIPRIRTEFDRADYHTASASVEAILRIALRMSAENAILALNELQPEKVSRSLLDAVFHDSESIGRDVFIQGLGHKSGAVRLLSIRVLRAREELEEQVAEQLLSDTNTDVRYEAMEYLMDSGRKFSDQEARDILVRQAAGTLGAFGAPDESHFERYRDGRLRMMTTEELERVSDEQSIFGQTALFVLADRDFTSRSGELRKAVRDHYKAMFDASVEQIPARYGGAGAGLVEQAKTLEEFIRKNLTRKGLDVVCLRGGIDDLDLVRSVLSSEFVPYSDNDLEFLRRYGSWEDIPLIVKSLDRWSFAGSGRILADPEYSKVARAIVALGRGRLAELLAVEMPHQLLSHLIVHSTDKEFRDLTNEEIKLLFEKAHDGVRKAAALKCIRSFSKGRLTALMAEYLSEETRFYNVVHWLDLGISTSRRAALRAATKAISMGYG